MAVKDHKQDTVNGNTSAVLYEGNDHGFCSSPAKSPTPIICAYTSHNYESVLCGVKATLCRLCLYRKDQQHVFRPSCTQFSCQYYQVSSSTAGGLGKPPNYRYHNQQSPGLVCKDDRLVGLVEKAWHPCRERKIPGSNPACAEIFTRSSHTSDLKIGTPVATLPGAWRYRVSTGTNWPGVSIL